MNNEEVNQINKNNEDNEIHIEVNLNEDKNLDYTNTNSAIKKIKKFHKKSDKNEVAVEVKSNNIFENNNKYEDEIKIDDIKLKEKERINVDHLDNSNNLTNTNLNTKNNIEFGNTKDKSQDSNKSPIKISEDEKISLNNIPGIPIPNSKTIIKDNNNLQIVMFFINKKSGSKQGNDILKLIPKEVTYIKFT